MTDDRWAAGDAYEAYMGRWSRKLARRFVAWLEPAPEGHWLEVGCGTGALTATLREECEPASVVACDPSAPFVEHARERCADERVSFVVAGADALPRRHGGYDAVVSGLVLNFLGEPGEALVAFRDRLRPRGTVAAYVWDYAEGMEFLRVFWDEAVAADPSAASVDEGRRFPLCREGALTELFRETGLADVRGGAVDVGTEFASFDDYWSPFLRGTGPAPAYVAALDPERRELLRERIRRRLVPHGDGPIRLRARAWAARGAAS